MKVKFTGGREVKGILKGQQLNAVKPKHTTNECQSLEHEPVLEGHDAVANLVLDDVQEQLSFQPVSTKLNGLCWNFRNICETLKTPTRLCGFLSESELRFIRLCTFQVSDETRTLGLVVARGTSAKASDTRTFSSAPSNSEQKKVRHFVMAFICFGHADTGLC